MDMLLGWGRQKCTDFGERTKCRFIQTLILRSGVVVLEEGILLLPARRNVVLVDLAPLGPAQDRHAGLSGTNVRGNHCRPLANSDDAIQLVRSRLPCE